MNHVLVEPFRKSTPSGKRLIVLLLIFHMLMSCNYQVIPLIFFRPKFYCQSMEGVAVCDELDACRETSVKFSSDYEFSSISMEYKLYCETKKDEATILTFMMIGHLVGAATSSFLSDLGHHKHSILSVLIVNGLISGISCLTAGLAHSPFFIGLALTVWSLSSEMIQNFINMAPTSFFEKQLPNEVFNLIEISWAVYSIFTPATLDLHQSWRAIFVVNLALPWFLFTAYFWYYRKELATEQTQKGEKDLSQELLTINEMKRPVQEVKHLTSVTYRDMARSSHLHNIFLYFIVFAGSYVGIMTSTLTLGTLNGNIYFNLTFICVMEVILTTVGGYLASCFSVKKGLGAIYLFMAIGYAFSCVQPEYLRSIVIILGKILTDVSWVMLSSLTITVTPIRFIPLIMSTRAICNLCVSMLMPYIKYFMELMRLSIFVFAAVYQTVAYICLRYIRERDLSLP